MTGYREFALLGDLPTGTTVLEASAGTGKTFTIAALVTRYVAEGVATLDQLLVVTFGRAATQELRDRVRERLVSARDGLADPAAALLSTDALLVHLAGGEPEVRRGRLEQALASFDSATVATTHQFCQQVLIGLGAAGDIDRDAVFVDNVNDLVAEVVDDLYLRKWGRDGAAAPTVNRKAAHELARVVVGDSQAVLVPESGDPSQATRRAFAVAVRKEVDRRKRRRRLLGFDDLLTRLRDILADPHLGRSAAARLRARYTVVLVDEFQDTDPVQWDILKRAFHGAATLVLIGDPKQAIYAFRGADVLAYLDAVEVAGEKLTLAKNFRSDPGLLLGLQGLFRGAALGDSNIVVSPVSAGHPGRCLAVDGPPVRLRAVLADVDVLGVTQARERVVADVVAEIVQLLDSGALLTPRDGSGERPVRPGDIAVLVGTGKQMDQVHAALLAAGVPSVRRGSASVFATQAATDWVVLLEALEQPHRRARLRRLALTGFVGWDAARLDTGDDDALSLELRAWLVVLEERGIAALFDTVSRAKAVAARLLSLVDGERYLTDLRQVGEAVHEEAMQSQLGLTASLQWLRRRVDESQTDLSQERSRRLDSDAAAVQVVTIHSSKGLEFPVVHVPFVWDCYVHTPEIPLFHDDQRRRVLDVGGRGPGFDLHKKQHNAEELGEDLRLLYVALTRAQGQVTAWWAPTSKNTPNSALHRLLFTASPAAGVPDRVPVRSRTAAWSELVTHRSDVVSVTEVQARPAAVWAPTGQAAASLELATLGRTTDLSWRRTSYSALTAGTHEAHVSSESELAQKDDEPALLVQDAAGGEEHLRAVPSPMGHLPGGTSFGTLVHAALEELDPGDLAQLSSLCAKQLARQAVGDLTGEELAAALEPSLRTPLGPLADGKALVDIPAGDRLVELDFELPLCGGDVSVTGQASLGDIARLLTAHLPANDPVQGYAELLSGLAGASLRGYLGGSIDAVLRVGGRYLVVDYKTNYLGSRDEDLTAWHYRSSAVNEAMLHAHYPLQALLYDVALHRYLRWRVAAYDPEQHLGGVLYLFLRGMCGPGVTAADGSVPGVFAWRPPAALVVATSDLLARGVR